MIHKFSRYLLTLVALFAMTTGAWAQTVTVTWTLTDLEANPDVTTFTKDGVTIKCSDRMSSGKSFNGPVTISTTLGNFTKIEITGSNSAPTTADGFTNDGNVSTWTGNAASISTPAAIAHTTQFVFTIAPAGPTVTLNEAKTEATMEMPAYDATVSYELVRDMAQGVAFSGLPEGDGCIVKKDGDKYTFATTPTIALEDNISGTAQAITAEGITLNVYPMVEVVIFEDLKGWKADETATPVALADFLASPQPGRWMIKATAETGLYDGTLYSPEFTLAEAYDLTLSPATNANLKSVTVAGTAKTADEKGVIKNIEPTKKVKITTTGPDYIIRKAVVKKTVNLLTLNVGGDAPGTITYAEGETWGQAIQNHATENQGWTIGSSGSIFYNGLGLWVGSNRVKKDDPITPGTNYYTE